MPNAAAKASTVTKARNAPKRLRRAASAVGESRGHKVLKAPRTQQQRTNDTRDKLTTAAIALLHKVGYSATTVTLVAEEAGVSRGAMSHQFPTKQDLMVAVVGRVFDEDAEYYRTSVTKSDPREWLQKLPDRVWEVMSRPAAIAVMEIMLAARSDKQLAKKVRAIQTRNDQVAEAWIEQRFRAASVQPRPDSEAIDRLFVAAARGLAMEMMFLDNRADVEKSLVVLSELYLHLYPGLRK